MNSYLKSFRQSILGTLLLFLCLSGCKSVNNDNGSNPVLWLTTANEAALIERLEGRLKDAKADSDNPVIEVNTSQTFQAIDGFGYTLTGGSAIHLNNMNASARAELLQELFGQEEGEIGISYLRVSIGASDLDPAPFSYNDLPEGETDVNMEQFSLDPDRQNLIPVLKEILEIYPDLIILGSPWSPPVWMKTFDIAVENEREEDLPPTVGGALDTRYEEAYARYFVKYIQEMAEEGITIDAVTIQNEPLHPRNNPSLYMSAAQQKDFIKDHLGPAFEQAGIETKIILWDHNADNPQYPISILNDTQARQYVDGSAFHLYAGDISALSTVHDAHPDKNLYFTEQWIGAPGNFAQDLEWHTRNLIIGAIRNWSKVVLEWNLAADPNQDPHTDYGGCTSCLGALTINGNEVTRNPAYYIVAHASKFVRPGSERIESNEPEGLPNVAFKTPDNRVVIIVLNDTNGSREFNISVDGEEKTMSLFAGAVGTVVW